MGIMELSYRYWTKSTGIGGRLEATEDFMVREILHPQLLRKSAGGKYALFLVRKRNMTTQQATEALQRLGWRDIGYAGLKDKFAVTWQYISAIAEAKEYESGDIHALPIGRSRKLLPGDLVANAFVITLHGCRNAELSKIIREIASAGVPNYFGLQRFGKSRNNHAIGKYLVKKRFDDALNLINSGANKKYATIRSVPKGHLKFFINAYQSWIFNEMLNMYIASSKKPYFGNAPVFGYSTSSGTSPIYKILRNICRKERVSSRDFRVGELMLSCAGSERQAFIRLSEIDYTMGRNVKLAFTLPKGSYATILLREICKERNIGIDIG